MSHDPPRTTFTSSRGTTVALVPLAGELDRLSTLRERFTVSPPTYDVPAAGGVVKTFPHEPPPRETPEDKKRWERYLAGDDTITYTERETSILTEEARAAWRDYLAAQARATREYGGITLRLLLVEAVRPTAEQLAAWEKKSAFIGLPVPDDPAERQYAWGMAELIGTAQDATDLMDAVAALNGVPEEMISEQLDSFRDPLERRDAAAGAAPAGPGAVLDVQPDLRTGGDGGGAAPEPKRVRRAPGRG